jgi:hypothetical protein
LNSDSDSIWTFSLWTLGLLASRFSVLDIPDLHLRKCWSGGWNKSGLGLGLELEPQLKLELELELDRYLRERASYADRRQDLSDDDDGMEEGASLAGNVIAERVLATVPTSEMKLTT